MEALEDHAFTCLNTDTMSRIGDINQRDIDLI